MCDNIYSAGMDVEGRNGLVITVNRIRRENGGKSNVEIFF